MILSDGLKHIKTEVKKDNETTALNFDDCISFAVVENVPFYPNVKSFQVTKKRRTALVVL
ncbi:hypothetical protein N7U66_14760 [Lacinutrix neustonica]|uniref:Uncharacterized protein n=1 Tax=Lacinutrix neustonica TaxID=2980107 RepID=A0A9E8SG35_9FLAO|nr:hypothetical protein [Lacinutrix neustonica]WAC01325.1 hypothetical protein N7U66_14760 [Lacinutrix neustonica]